MGGFIYIVSNPAHPGQVKIGMTTQSVAKRVSQLQTGSPHPFKIEWQVVVSDPKGVEALAHRRLSHRRTSGEWFAVGVSDAVEAILASSDEARIIVSKTTAKKEMREFRESLGEMKWGCLGPFAVIGSIFPLNWLFGDSLNMIAALVIISVGFYGGFFIGRFAFEQVHRGPLSAKRAELLAKHRISDF